MLEIALATELEILDNGSSLMGDSSNAPEAWIINVNGLAARQL